MVLPSILGQTHVTDFHSFPGETQVVQNWDTVIMLIKSNLAQDSEKV